MSPMPTTLDSLPAEMLELISDNLEPHDILTFRFVCTELQKAAFKAFTHLVRASYPTNVFTGQPLPQHRGGRQCNFWPPHSEYYHLR